MFSFHFNLSLKSQINNLRTWKTSIKIGKLEHKFLSTIIIKLASNRDYAQTALDPQISTWFYIKLCYENMESSPEVRQN